MDPAATLRRHARDLRGDATDELVDAIGDARFVLIGEASHGSDEFYAIRAELTRRLIDERGFGAVAVEADWPDAARVDRFVRGADEPSPGEALGDFARFPRWMWRNTVVADFVAWLRGRNQRSEVPARFFGLDLYSLFTSIDAIVAYLDATDPEAAARARDRYACFDHAGVDGQRYGSAVAWGGRESCEDEVVEQLRELRHLGDGDRDAVFDAQQNARLVANAERYYRTMFRGRDDGWNLRDTHMADTLDALAGHLERDGAPPKVVVWAHNSHLGDARATEMGWGRGELNLGQLTRERHPGETVNVGFTTYDGEVTAASDWGGTTERKRVRPGLPGSHEAVLHDVAGATGHARFWIDLRDEEVRGALDRPRLERAIGVIYRPETERISHYFEAVLPDQFDVVVHVDRTSALQPLDREAAWEEGAVPDTYPWAV